MPHDPTVSAGKKKPLPPGRLAAKAPRPAGAGPGPPRPAPTGKKSKTAPPPGPSAKQQAGDANQQATEEEQDDEDGEEGPHRRRLLVQLPSWMLSLVFHLIALLLLALLTFELPHGPGIFSLSSSLSEEEGEELEELSVEVDIADLEEMPELETTSALEAMAIDVGQIAAGDVTAEASVASTEVALNDSVLGEIGDLFADQGKAMSEIAGGRSASFFGVKTSGDRFIYVVDNSNSMSRGKFETSVHEIIRSVQQLDKYQYFYVIFYSDTAYPLFYPQSARRFVRATPENKQKLQYWLGTVHRCLQTRGEGAMSLAFSLRPDVIYLLGDGAFTDKAVDKTLLLKGAPVTIHTLGFNMRPQDVKGFEKIATAFNGKFRDVKVTPAMVELSKKINRPKNNQPNGVWGLKLGKKKKK